MDCSSRICRTLLSKKRLFYLFELFWDFRGQQTGLQQNEVWTKNKGHRCFGQRLGKGSSLVKRQFIFRALVTSFAICWAAWLGTRVCLEIKAIQEVPKVYASLVLKEITRFKPFSKFMFSDQPIYSFHADLPMPPNLAVISLRRLWSGNMDNSRLAAALNEVRPGLIMLGNTPADTPFQSLRIHSGLPGQNSPPLHALQPLRRNHQSIRCESPLALQFKTLFLCLTILETDQKPRVQNFIFLIWTNALLCINDLRHVQFTT
jgi:hypothetical protein